jgi:NAD(P)-dependent dehydrogenase (short-subunit alcohol dehydrogenase family)
MVRRALIYGGSGGIGSATARLLRADGYEVHLVARDAERLAELANDIGATYTVGDVTDNDLPARVAGEAEGPWDGLVYAVGTINLRSFTRLTDADFATDFQVNAMGAALAVQGALPMLKKSSHVASVVLFSSVAALQGFSFHASMGMAKGAVSGLTLSLAAELAPKVRVNAIAPSLTRTRMADSIVANEKMAEAIAGLHALPRLGTADDIANLTAFLLSPGADWITGQIVSVDGGRSTLRTKS